MPIDRICLFGAGGHAKVVIDALRRAVPGGVEILLQDDNQALAGTLVAGLVVRPSSGLPAGGRFHVAIGANRVRAARFAAVAGVGAVPVTVIHPAACLASSAQVAEGTFVAAMAVVGPDSTVGSGTIVNHGAVVDHDCAVGRFCHIAPRAVLGGGVRLGDGVFIGSGAVVLPGLTLASDVVVGAGAVVTRSIDRAGTFVGIPARDAGGG